MRSGHCGRALRTVKGENQLSVFVFDTRSVRLENKPDAFSFKRFLEFSNDFRVFVSNDLLASVNDSDAATEAAEHLAKFEADVAAAKDQEMLGNGGELHDGLIREVPNV